MEEVIIIVKRSGPLPHGMSRYAITRYSRDGGFATVTSDSPNHAIDWDAVPTATLLDMLAGRLGLSITVDE